MCFACSVWHLGNERDVAGKLDESELEALRGLAWIAVDDVGFQMVAGHNGGDNALDWVALLV